MLELFYFCLSQVHPVSAQWIGHHLQMGPQICSSALPSTDFPALYHAIVCGVPLPPGRTKLLFIDSGLIHLMVVSGAHLALLEILIQKISKRAVGPFLIFYSFMTGLQPPVVRALVRRLLRPTSHEYGFSSVHMELVTTLVILILYPPWLTSRSFLMSWMCGLAIASPRWSKHFDIPIKCYVFLLPFCWLTPVTLFWNALLEPAIGLVLFPLSLGILLIPPIHIISDWGWRWLLRILSQGPAAHPADLYIESSHLVFLVISAQALLILGEIQWRRAYAFLSSSS